MTTLLWLRRDLRRADHPALAAAAADGPVTVLFVLDPEFFDGAGSARSAWLAATLRATESTYGGALVLRLGNAAEVVPAVAAEVGASAVHVSTETEPGGRTRDERVRASLAEAGIGWAETGSPYAVTPGRVLNRSGQGFQVFTPFSRAWREHGWRVPAVEPPSTRFVTRPSDPKAWARLDAALTADGVPDLPPAGEEAALARWHEFLDGGLEAYAEERNRPDLDATSRMSAYLKFGVVHPRTLLAGLAPHEGSPGAERLVTELAWREFYADVLHRHPASLWNDLRPLGLEYDDEPGLVERWRQGTTGFPLVDAGMRQLAATGWMHNRVRMATASFLVKDLHTPWQTGAQHFLDRLIDGDLASNNHGWQWVAGTGTDASPYVRVFNPVLQGQRFDPRGDYVRRWVPELRHLAGAAVHTPWDATDGYAHSYPQPVVDHAEERRRALARYERTRGA